MISNPKIKVHFMPGDGHGWALDEDLRQMREALSGCVQEVPLVRAQVIHTPFWQGLEVVHPEILKQAFIIAHADNPPFFYLKQPEFILGQQQVDLWVARSKEAFEQFHALRLPVTYIPYTIDEKIFFPLKDIRVIRKKFGISENAYVIANFHRDSEGADLTQPKFQKAPELMLAILKELKHRDASFHVLLAGPRRHWMRQALEKENIPFTFVGERKCEKDDFGINILDRSTLNELINAADLMLIPSRWEGGPQSIMEGAASHCKILSTPIGLAHDILEPISLYQSVSEAVDRILEDQVHNILHATLQPQWQRWYQSHTTASMRTGLCELYADLAKKNLLITKYTTHPSRTSQDSWIKNQGRHILHTLRRRFGTKKLPSALGWHHQVGHDPDLDAIFSELENILDACYIKRQRATGEGIEFIGWSDESLPKAQKKGYRFQWVVPSMPLSQVLPGAVVIAPGVQDSVNLRREGFLNSTIVLPVSFFECENRMVSNEPLVIEEGNHSASIKIWRAMAASRPILYPKDSAYYPQVFHGGFSYKNKEEIPMLLDMARKEAPRIRMLGKVPSRDSGQKAIRQLLKMNHQI